MKTVYCPNRSLIGPGYVEGREPATAEMVQELTRRVAELESRIQYLEGSPSREEKPSHVCQVCGGVGTVVEWRTAESVRPCPCCAGAPCEQCNGYKWVRCPSCTETEAKI